MCLFPWVAAIGSKSPLVFFFAQPTAVTNAAAIRAICFKRTRSIFDTDPFDTLQLAEK
jgi:hypothetical protein